MNMWGLLNYCLIRNRFLYLLIIFCNNLLHSLTALSSSSFLGVTSLNIIIICGNFDFKILMITSTSSDTCLGDRWSKSLTPVLIRIHFMFISLLFLYLYLYYDYLLILLRHIKYYNSLSLNIRFIFFDFFFHLIVYLFFTTRCVFRYRQTVEKYGRESR